MTTRLKSMTKAQLEGMIQTSAEVLRQHRELHAAQLLERDAKIEALLAQVKSLEDKTGRPVVREAPATVKALPALEAGQDGRYVCPTDAAHGAVVPNTRGLCPKCFTEAVKTDRMARHAPAAA